MFYGIENIPHNIPKYSYILCDCGIYSGILCGIMSVSHNIVMNLNNVMHSEDELD